MRKFQSYPIYVNNPGRWEEVRRRQRDEFVDQGDYKMMTWLDWTGKDLYATLEDKTPSPESREYENRVYKLLMLIGSIRPGKLVLDSMNPNLKHWIVPFDDLDKSTCDCSAFTFPGVPKGGGGVRVHFNPDWNPSADPSKRYTGDDILFHELVHAYKIGTQGYDPSPPELHDGTSIEEFMALQLQNIYLSYRGGTFFYHSYRDPRGVSKVQAYESYVKDTEVLGLFRYFLNTEPLVQQVATWTRAADTFNPWRDLPMLEQRYRAANPGKVLLPFGDGALYRDL
jgi:hypothetical protein